MEVLSRVKLVADVTTFLEPSVTTVLEALFRTLPRAPLEWEAAVLPRLLRAAGQDGALVTGSDGQVVGLVTLEDLVGPRMEREAA